jgi:hypothetical protein
MKGSAATWMRTRTHAHRGGGHSINSDSIDDLSIKGHDNDDHRINDWSNDDRCSGWITVGIRMEKAR